MLFLVNIESHSNSLSDLDHDGELVIDELECIIGRMVDPHMKPADVSRVAQRMFLEADMDRSGSLSISEFWNLVNRLPEFERYEDFSLLFIVR